MIRSAKFWIGTILLAVIPLLLIDIGHHTVDWGKEVKGEIIDIAYHAELFPGDQKSQALETAFDKNTNLTFLIYLKSLLSLLFLVLGIYLLVHYVKKNRPGFLKPAMAIAVVMICFLSVKVFLLPRIITNDKIRFLTLAKDDTALQNLYNANFKGKVVYIDFWGTTCGPCLDEFRHFTQPLKNKYKSKNISFLYICGGSYLRHEYMWREQIKKYNIEGNHIFLEFDQYANLYRNLVDNKKILITMPRYMILDKTGKVVISDAKRPSDRDSLSSQLNRYL